MLWIDISVNTIFGFQPPILAPIQQAGIPMQNPKIGNKFNAALQKARTKHNIPHQIVWLEQRAKEGLFDQDDAALYEHITELDDKLRDTCKKNIQKKYAGNVPFSDVIGKDRKETRLWKLALKRKQGRMDSRKIRRLMHTFQQPRALYMSLMELLQAQTACVRWYKANKLNTVALRKEFEKTVNLNRALKYQPTAQIWYVCNATGENNEECLPIQKHPLPDPNRHQTKHSSCNNVCRIHGWSQHRSRMHYTWSNWRSMY
jgi:hypothetical protein